MAFAPRSWPSPRKSRLRRRIQRRGGLDRQRQSGNLGDLSNSDSAPFKAQVRGSRARFGPPRSPGEGRRSSPGRRLRPRTPKDVEMRRTTSRERPRRCGAARLWPRGRASEPVRPRAFVWGEYHDGMDPLLTATSAQGPATTSIATPMRLLRPEQASEILGVPVATLEAWPGTPRGVDRKARALCTH